MGQRIAMDAGGRLVIEDECDPPAKVGGNMKPMVNFYAPQRRGNEWFARADVHLPTGTVQIAARASSQTVAATMARLQAMAAKRLHAWDPHAVSDAVGAVLRRGRFASDGELAQMARSLRRYRFGARRRISHAELVTRQIQRLTAILGG